MVGIGDLSASHPTNSRRPCGYLLAPFKWAAEPLSLILESKPELLSEILFIDRRRMHLIALAFARFDLEVPRELSEILIRGSAGAILDRTLGHRPVCLKGVVDRLPSRVLEPEGYRRLIRLLEDSATAKSLSHAEVIDDSILKVLDELPSSLRSVVLTLADGNRIESLADGLRHLVARGAAPSYETLMAELQLLRQPKQLIAKLNRMAEALPLPEAMPPKEVGCARRLDHPTELRRLAKRWRNCIEFYLSDVDSCLCAFYHWDDAHEPALCMVRRHGRYGWFFDEAKGPENIELSPERFDEIRSAFATLDIPNASVIGALEELPKIIRMRRRLPRARTRQQAEPPRDSLFAAA